MKFIRKKSYKLTIMRFNVCNVSWQDPEDERVQMGCVARILDDNRHMVRALGHNEFSERVQPIPEGASFDSLSDFQRRYFCMDAVPYPNLNGIDLKDWEQYSQGEHLTIEDVMNLNEGDKLHLLVMDRNLWDIVCCRENNLGNTLHPPAQFFRHNRATYTHIGDLKGTLVYHWGDGDSEEYDFEFDVEYMSHRWYPLKDGHLPARDPQGIAPFDYEEPKPWTDFPVNTRVGWRGPMMLWEKVIPYDNIFWYDDMAPGDED
jgi:hypothetical protein